MALQGSGDQKFVPSISSGTLETLASRSSKLKSLYEKISPQMFNIPPYGLGFPCMEAQSAYYPGPMTITQNEIAMVSQALEERKVLPENTRIRKLEKSGTVRFEVLQASVEDDIQPPTFLLPDSQTVVAIKRGDHAEELAKICSNLSEAAKYADNDTQRKFLSEYIQSFLTGNLEVYRNSQRTWITDKNPRVENIFGFVEPYRDPYGIRSEFEGLVAINDPAETKILLKLVEQSSTFIKRLPWAEGQMENNGKGPFEKALFEPPDLTSIHGIISTRMTKLWRSSDFF
jgi:dipeptidyl-peptidase-3